jgi:GrpB-like predicted nucleotidyltransferase (UPF0157 family)
VERIEVVAYDPRWPEIFDQERERIISSLKGDCLAIHHIGSTSVPGLAAKPKIDIVAVAKDRRRAIENLERLGYTYRGEWNIPLKCGFTRRDGPSVNLHLFFDGDHPEIELNLRFRDYLRTHPEARREYVALKEKILQDESAYRKVGKLALTAYAMRKSEFIGTVLRKAGFRRLRVLKCWTDAEWAEAKKFQQSHYARLATGDPALGENGESTEREHFILYHGVDMVGYAQICTFATEMRLCVFETLKKDAASWFQSVLAEWIRVNADRAHR